MHFQGTAATLADFEGDHMPTLRTSISRMAMTAAAVCALAAPAAATEGYAAHGFGARNKALGGAGVADSRDATAASLNPAGLTHVGDEITASMSVFSPQRGFSTTGFGPALPGNDSVNSDREYFFIPNIAWSTRAFKNALFDVAAFTMVGNGGMNTSFPDFANNGCAGPFAPPPGVQGGAFCRGEAGVNLLQMIMSVALAKQIAPGISVGVAPMMALQTFESRGLELFGDFNFSNDAARLSGSRNDWGYGFGLRGGIEIQPMQNVRIGVTGTTPFWMQDFNKYEGLFANQGEFFIPASLQAGIAVDVSPNLTLMLDWRHIWFGSVDSISNPSTNIFGCAAFNPDGSLAGGTAPGASCLGGSNGPGFGWKDVDAIKFGVEYRHSDKLTLRGGYAYNTQPVRSRDVHFNILAPAVTQHHITGGLEYDLGNGYHLELAGMYSPEIGVSGPNLFDPNQRVEIDMWQYEVTVGVKYKFDEAAPPLK